MEISDPADFYCCRICLQNGENSINLESIFEAYQDKIEITPANMISTITPVKIIYNDGYPTQICTTCKSNLDIAYQFYHSVISSDRKLRSSFASKSEAIKQEIEKTEQADDDEEFERFDASYEDQNEDDDDEMHEDSLPISHLEIHVNEVKSEEANLADDIEEEEEDEDSDDSEDDEPIINIKRKRTRNRMKTPKEKVEHKCEVCNKIFAKPYR
jgi:hypothetical protein